MKLFKNTQSKRSLLSKCGVDEQIFLSDVYKKRTQSKKYQSDAPQFGRSMVEMLGVLAIIGVLSVGGIAGYSKAMYKHKMNKTIEVLSQILNNLVILDGKSTDNAYIINAQHAIDYGIISDCDLNYTNFEGKKGVSCPLPITGGEWHPEFMAGGGDRFSGILNIALTENHIENCIAILSSGLHNIYPDDWWNPCNNESMLPGGITVDGTLVYTKNPWLPDYHNLSKATITNVCEQACSDSSLKSKPYKVCFVTFGIRIHG